MYGARIRFVAVSGLLLAWLGMATAGRATGSVDEAKRDEPGGVQVVRWSAPRSIAAPRRIAAATAGVGVKFVPVTVPPVGRVPLALAFTPDHAEVAIANRDSDNVTFLDVASGTVKRTVAVGDGPLSVAVTPDGRYALTADVFGNTVSVIDLATHALTKKVAVGGRSPYAIKVTQDSRFAVVGLINDARTSAFSVIDLATLHEIRTIQTAPQGSIGGIAILGFGLSADIFTRFALTPDGRKIVLAAYNQAAVIVYDRATGATLGTVPVAAGPWDVDVSSDGAFAVVGHEGGTGRITRIDLGTLHATAFPLPVDPFFQINRITLDRRFAIVGGSNEVVFVNLQTGAITSSVPSRRPNDIILTADGRFALVATYQSSVLDVAAQKLSSPAPVSFYSQLWVGAASSGPPLVAALDSLDEESVYLFDLGTPGITLRAAVPSGEPPEGHAPRSAALAADGSVAVVTNRISGNVAVVDAGSGTLRGLIDTGSAPLDVALTPDRAWAVVANSQSSSVSVIDVAGLRVAATLPVAALPDRVLLAPDGRTAYVFSELDPGTLSFVALDGAQSHVVATLPTVGRTSAIGVGPFDSQSGVALSADGSVLAVCGTDSGQLQLIDAVARREIARVPVGTFPLRVALSADGSRAWVAGSLSDDVTVVRRAGGGAAVEATVTGIPRPYDLWLDPAGAFVYVVSAGNPALYVLDAARNSVEAVIDVPSPSGFGLGTSRLVPALSMLYVAAAIDNPLRGAMLRFALAGAETHLVDATPLSDYPSDIAVSSDGRAAVLSQVALDGVDIAGFAPPGPCAANATQLCLRGSRFAVTVDWRTPQAQTGAGQALPLTTESGLFWFFAPSNLELVVKVLDGCAVNGHYWVFAGGLTNVEVALHVTDTATGAVRTYTNRLQTPYQPIQDTVAFATCP
jgi:YVTN family beta-propeller protein